MGDRDQHNQALSQNADQLVMLGRIDGKLDAVQGHLARQDARLDAIDERLREVEKKAAISGALSGGVMSVGVALIIEGFKNWLRVR